MESVSASLLLARVGPHLKQNAGHDGAVTMTANRLGSEPSAYLKSAARQPVAWRPWGEEAFSAARAEDKPILLDVGAVWCHWCHNRREKAFFG